MRLMLTLLAMLMTATTALAQGRNAAPPQNVNVVNVPDVAVSNVVDVNIANAPAVEVSNSIDITRMAGFSLSGEAPLVIERLIAPGRIHGFTLSLRPLAVPFVGRCDARFVVAVSLSTGGIQADIAELNLKANGEAEVMQHDFTSPIDVRFDPSTESASAVLFIDDRGPGAQCRAQVSVIYETL